jgi:hypothetical protein
MVASGRSTPVAASGLVLPRHTPSLLLLLTPTPSWCCPWTTGTDEQQAHLGMRLNNMQQNMVQQHLVASSSAMVPFVLSPFVCIPCQIAHTPCIFLLACNALSHSPRQTKA